MIEHRNNMYDSILNVTEKTDQYQKVLINNDVITSSLIGTYSPEVRESLSFIVSRSYEMMMDKTLRSSTELKHIIYRTDNAINRAVINRKLNFFINDYIYRDLLVNLDALQNMILSHQLREYDKTEYDITSTTFLFKTILESEESRILYRMSQYPDVIDLGYDGCYDLLKDVFIRVTNLFVTLHNEIIRTRKLIDTRTYLSYMIKIALTLSFIIPDDVYDS